MFRVDFLAHGGSGNDYTGTLGIGERTLCAVYLSARLSIYLSLARKNGEERNT